MTHTSLGAMSGTSLDGVDAAVVVTDGEAIAAFGPTAYRPYTDEERRTLRAALGRWDGPEVEAASQVVTAAHAELLAGVIAAPDASHRVPGDIAPVHPPEGRHAAAPDLAGFHGQTLAHAPRERRTLQVGDGAALARALGIPVAWDFRSADVAAGGEGAPLAPLFHHAAARWAGLEGAVAVLNLGGVGNLTWLDTGADPEAPGAILAFDTGPANAPIDDLVALRTGAARDEGGALAVAGRADEGIVARFLDHAYLARPAPKSLDRDDFPWLAEATADLPTEDAAATLTAVAAAGVAAGLGLCPARPARVLVAGGGRHNPALMAALAARAGTVFDPVESVGLDGDMLEAQAFAYLAVRVKRGLPLTLPGTTGVARPMTGGRISRP